MDFKTFLKQLDARGWGVVSFNTTQNQFIVNYTLKVSQNGDRGWFIKSEGIVFDMETAFEDIINEIGKWK